MLFWTKVNLKKGLAIFNTRVVRNLPVLLDVYSKFHARFRQNFMTSLSLKFDEALYTVSGINFITEANKEMKVMQLYFLLAASFAAKGWAWKLSSKLIYFEVNKSYIEFKYCDSFYERFTHVLRELLGVTIFVLTRFKPLTPIISNKIHWWYTVCSFYTV